MEIVFSRYSIDVFVELDVDIRFSRRIMHMIVLKSKAIDNALNDPATMWDQQEVSS